MNDEKTVRDHVREEVKAIEEISYNTVQCDDIETLKAAVYKINQHAHGVIRVIDNYRLDS